MSHFVSPHLSKKSCSEQACVCSAYIPVYCGLIPPTLQGVVSKCHIIQRVFSVILPVSVFDVKVNSLYWFHCWRLVLTDFYALLFLSLCFVVVTFGTFFPPFLKNVSVLNGTCGNNNYKIPLELFVSEPFFFPGHVTSTKVFYEKTIVQHQPSHPPCVASVMGCESWYVLVCEQGLWPD